MSNAVTRFYQDTDEELSTHRRKGFNMLWMNYGLVRESITTWISEREHHNSLGGYESRWKIEFGFEYFTGNHERRHLEEGISISFACTVYMY